MGRKLSTTMVVAVLGTLLVAAAAHALRLDMGRTVIFATAEVSPSKLPEKGNVPIELTSIVKVRNRDGSLPPRLQKLVLQFDRNGYIDAKGIPVCTEARLRGKTPKAARAACRKSIVGTGTGKAVVTLPGQAPIEVSSPLTLFNGPKVGGMPSLIAHAYERVPVANALVVPIRIERIHSGRYGYRTQIEMPEIAGGYGAATLSETTVSAIRKRGGRSVGFANAHCSGGRVQVYGTLSFADGGFANGTIAQGCEG